MNLPPTKYYGAIKFERSLENYHVSLSSHKMGDRIPKHSHKNPYLSLNIGVPYLEINSFQKIIVEPGKVILRPSEYIHENKFENKTGLCFNVEVTNPSNPDVLQLFVRNDIYYEPLEFLQLLVKSYGNYFENELDCLITETLLRKPDSSYHIKTPPWYKKVISIVKEDAFNPLTLRYIAQMVGLHPNYLARKFKAINGTTLGDYIRNTRIEKASLMMASKKSLTEIALESGFYDQPHFSHTFRSVLNVTPRSLKKLLLG